jgi:hypothetical protein
MAVVVEVWKLIVIDTTRAIWLCHRAREDSLNGVHDGGGTSLCVASVCGHSDYVEKTKKKNIGGVLLDDAASETITKPSKDQQKEIIVPPGESAIEATGESGCSTVIDPLIPDISPRPSLE